MMDIVLFFAQHTLFFLFVVVFFALFIGSFLNVVIYRFPRMLEASWKLECSHYLNLKIAEPTDKLNLALPASHCPNCKTPIRPWHNIPLLSYLCLRGRSACCNTPISLRYPLVEALTAVLSLIVAWHFGVSFETLAALAFTWILIALFFIDLDTQLLPDQLTLLLLWLGLFCSMFALFCTSDEAILGAIIGYCTFAIIQKSFLWLTGKDGMGQGDLKFLAALGAFLGWQSLPLIILLSSVIGLLIAGGQMLYTRQFHSKPLPFGPYLAIAGWIALLWGSAINTYYLSM